MTEAEWLSCSNPTPMFVLLRSTASDRKLRLIVCELLRRDLPVGLADAQRAIELGEQWADRQVSAAEIEDFRRSTLADPDYADWIALAGLAASAVGGCIGSGTDLAGELPSLFREVFGNPFRSAPISPAWLTSTVVALARGIYEEKAFDRMPILADALQDAGCDNEDILTHCRETSVAHVRGCWVVDRILGKV
jgi:hypothetical protein